MHVFWWYMMLFAFYSVLGWLGDTIYTRVYEGRWFKRGFHHGPFYMLYGWGALVSILLFDQYSPLLLVIPLAIIYSSIIEYAASALFERIGLSFWDYHENRLNLNGRICAQSISVFVAGIVGLVYIVQPMLESWLVNAPQTITDAIGILAFLYLIVWGLIRLVIQYRYYREHHTIRSQAYDLAEN